MTTFCSFSMCIRLTPAFHIYLPQIVGFTGHLDIIIIIFLRHFAKPIWARCRLDVVLPFSNLLYPSPSPCQVRPNSLMSSLTTSSHVFLGLPFGLTPPTSILVHFFSHSSSSFLSTCPNHRSRPLLNTYINVSIPNHLLSSSFLFLSLSLTPHINLTICISALSILCTFSPFNAHVSLPYNITLLTHIL